MQIFQKLCDEKYGGRIDEMILLAYSDWLTYSNIKSTLFLKDAIVVPNLLPSIVYLKRNNTGQIAIKICFIRREHIYSFWINFLTIISYFLVLTILIGTYMTAKFSYICSFRKDWSWEWTVKFYNITLGDIDDHERVIVCTIPIAKTYIQSCMSVTNKLEQEIHCTKLY